MLISGLKTYKISLKVSIKYLIIALYPILSVYIILPGITLGNLIVFIYFIYKLLVLRRINLDSSLLALMVIFICSNLSQLLLHHDVNTTLVLHNTFSMVLFLIVTISLTMDTEDNLFRLYRYLKIISVICSLGLIFQIICWTFFHARVTLFIPGIERIAYQSLHSTIFRPGSFFTEPSHFAIFLLPVFALSLVKKDYGYSVFSFLVILISTSSLGIITSVFVIIWHFKEIIFNKINARKFLFFGIAFILFVVFLVLFEPKVISFALSKLLTIFGKDSSPRILGSLNYISFFNFSQIIFGIGLNQFSYLVHLKLGLDVPNFSNSLVFSFISFGIIGLIIWVLYIYSVLSRLPKEYTSLGVIFLCLCATDQVLFTQNLVYLLVILSIVSRTKGFQMQFVEETSINKVVQ